MSFFITFEGIEGSGKSTQIELTSGWLRSQGIPHVITREPGGTAAGEAIRHLLLHEKEVPLDPVAETILFSAARYQLLQEIILPVKESGQWVLCDRFVDSTLCYQGFGRGVGEEKVRHLHSIIGGVYPDMTFYLDLPVSVGLQRVAHKLKDRFESLDSSFHNRVREGYLYLAEKEKHRFVVLDGTLPPEQIQANIRAILQSRCLKSS